MKGKWWISGSKELKKQKEQKRLASELKKVDQKKRRVLKHCQNASTEDLLEVLRHRTVRAQKRAESASSADPAPNNSAEESED